MEHEKRIMEQTWHINDAEKESISESFLIKEKKKMIFIHEEKAYGFGFGENEKNRTAPKESSSFHTSFGKLLFSVLAYACVSLSFL
mgnify:CR=1 FL=1